MTITLFNEEKLNNNKELSKKKKCKRNNCHLKANYQRTQNNNWRYIPQYMIFGWNWQHELETYLQQHGRLYENTGLSSSTNKKRIIITKNYEPSNFLVTPSLPANPFN